MISVNIQILCNRSAQIEMIFNLKVRQGTFNAKSKNFYVCRTSAHIMLLFVKDLKLGQIINVQFENK